MALRINNQGNVEIVTPPKSLTKEERAKLENAKANKKLLEKASSMKFNIVYG